MRAFLYLLFAGFLTTCARAPQIPKLDRLPPQSPTPILGNSLSLSDIRKLFLGVNRDGSFNAIRSYFQAMPEKSAEDLAKLFSQTVYESASAVHILEDRIDRKFFSKFEERLKTDSDLLSLLRALLKNKKTYELAAQGNEFFSPQWHANLKQIALPSEDFSHVYEMLKHISNPVTAPTLVKHVESLSQNGFEESLLWSMHELNVAHGASTFAILQETFSQAFESGNLKGALELLSEMNQAADGFVSEIQKAMREMPQLLETVEIFLEPVLIESLTNYSTEALKEADQGDFSQVYFAFEQAVQKVSGSLLDADDFVAAFPKRLNAYLLTRWFFDRGVEKIGFEAERWEKDFSALGYEKFFRTLVQLRKEGAIPALDFGMPQIAQGSSLETALPLVIKEIHHTRPIVSSTAFLNQMGFLLSRFSPVPFDTFEKNLLYGINLKLRMPYSEWQMWKRILHHFNSAENRPYVEEFFRSSFGANEALFKKAQTLLDGVALIEELDGPTSPTLFEAYHSLVQELRVSALRPFGNFLSFLFREHWLEKSWVRKFVKGPTSLGPAFTSLSRLELHSLQDLLRPWKTFVKRNGVETALSLFQEIDQQQASSLKRAFRQPKDFAFFDLSEDELAWIQDFLATPKLATTLSDLPSASGMVPELESLQSSGAFRRAVLYLANASSDRLRQLGTVLLKMDASGELASAIRIILLLGK